MDETEVEAQQLPDGNWVETAFGRQDFNPTDEESRIGNFIRRIWKDKQWKHNQSQ